MSGALPSSSNPKSVGKIFFSSEEDNGISWDLSDYIFHNLSRFSIDVDIVDIKDYVLGKLPKGSLIVIVVSIGKDQRSSFFEAHRQWLEAGISTRSTLLEECKFVIVAVKLQGYAQGMIDSGVCLATLMRGLGASQILPLWIADVHSPHLYSSLLFWTWKLVGRFKGYVKVETDVSDSEDNLFEKYTDRDILYRVDEYDSAAGLDELDSDESAEEEIHESEEDGMSDHDGKESKKPRVMLQGPVLYVLLEHLIGQRNAADHMWDESERISVVSLYRVEIQDKAGHVTSQPLGPPVFNFPFDRYPVGMGCGAVGSKIIFVGGHYHDPISAKKNPSKKMYILDTSYIKHATGMCDHEKLLEIRESPELNKSDPIVLNAQGKLYVLPRNFGSWNGINPTIESYDLQQGIWKIFDIFGTYEGPGSLKTHPQRSSAYSVYSYCVMNSMIFISLDLEAYAFDVYTEKLYLVGPERPCFRWRITGFHDGFHDGAVYADGWFFGLPWTNEVLFAFKHNPFEEYLSPDIYLLTPLGDQSMVAPRNFQGVISHLGKTNRLLVARSGIGLERLYLVFDFFSILKKAEYAIGSKLEDSIVVHTPYGSSSRITACLPIDEL